jgi:phosphodiesterase/alkaline phosphatase D-like protein
MATLNIPNNFTNGTPAVATEVNANFQQVKTFTEGIAAGTNLDDGSIVYSKLAAATVSALTTAGDNAQVVLGVQIFG